MATEFYTSSPEDMATTDNPLIQKLGEQQVSTFDCRNYHFTILTVLGGFLILIGLSGNGLTIAVLWKDRYKSATTFLLLCLAVLDCLVLISQGLLSIPASIAQFLGDLRNTYYWAAVSYAYITPICRMFLLMEIWTVVMVTWSRFVNVCIPYKAKILGSLAKARLQIGIITLASVVFSLPKFFEYKVQTQNPRLHPLVEQPLVQNDVYYVMFNIVLYYGLLYVAPFLCLLYMTCSLIKALHTFYETKKRLTSISVDNNKSEVTLSVVVVVIVFCVCHLVGPSIRLIRFLYPDRTCGTLYSKLSPWMPIAIEFSSAINFPVYMLCVRRFRVQIMAMFGGKGTNQVSPGNEGALLAKKQAVSKV